nr:unnamed protein product [uncultured bacterium]
MNRNVESHFAKNPTNIDISRSTFDRSSSVKLTFNTGEIIPFFIEEVLPGDTFKVKTSKVIRLQTLLTPMMDNIYLDTYYFFVPNRLVWEHWKEFNGENTQSAWIPEVEYQIPQLTAPEGGWNIGTLADYFGIPTGVSGISVNALPFRAYALVCNEWFRDQNLSDPLNIPVGDATVTGVNTGTFITDVVKGGLPYTAAKYHDYFTSCLPAPQKGPDVTIPVTSGHNLPVMFLNETHDAGPYKPFGVGIQNSELRNFYGFGSGSSGATSTSDTSSTVEVGSDGTGIGQNFWTPTNMWAVESGDVGMATINQLRLAFQLQKLYEKDARGGTRYTEIIRSHFGVVSPDSRLQRPEYLGGNRIPINVNQIIQQSQSTEQSPLGALAGMSVTTDKNSDFIKSFVEHGYIIGLVVARYDHTYQQGLDRMWSRKDRFDFYWPVLANIGEQAVLNKEIYIDGSDTDDEVFGYQEAWAEYRYKPNRVCGEMRSSAPQSLDVWHLGDDYSSLPYLSDSWIREDKTNVDRVLAVTSSVSDQLFADIYICNKATRPMPMYSIPGLIDHH